MSTLKGEQMPSRPWNSTTASHLMVWNLIDFLFILFWYLLVKLSFWFQRAAYEHTARHITDRHTAATHAGVSVEVLKWALHRCLFLTGLFLAFLVEAVVSWTEIVVEALEVCRKPVGDVAQAVPGEGVEVAEEGPTSSSFQQKNSMLS